MPMKRLTPPASAKKPKRQKKVMSLYEKVQLLDMINERKSYADVIRYYGMNECTLRYIKKDEQAIKARVDTSFCESSKIVNHLRKKAMADSNDREKQAENPLIAPLGGIRSPMRGKESVPDWQLHDRTATEFVQRWLTVHGFPNGHQPFRFPDDFRNCISFSAALESTSHDAHHAPFSGDFETASDDGDSPIANQSKGNSITQSVSFLHSCITQLCGGKSPPGVPTSVVLPVNQPKEALSTVYFYLAALTTFVRSQGGCLSHVLPEHLMSPSDYEAWHNLGCPGLTESARSLKLAPSTLTDTRCSITSRQPGSSVLDERLRGSCTERPDEDSLHTKNRSQNNPVPHLKLHNLKKLDSVTFESVSKRAWTDLMLQVLKCLIVQKIGCDGFGRLFHTLGKILTPKDPDGSTSITSDRTSTRSKSGRVNAPPSLPPLAHEKPSARSFQLSSSPVRAIQPDIGLKVSNCYSSSERALLAWINYCFTYGRERVWPSQLHTPQGPPSSRWIVNFDYDLGDGIVLACVVGLYVPCLIPGYISKLYTHPSTKEQCLHNAIYLVAALKAIRLDFDIRPPDITSPHPVAMLMFCLHLMQNLPDYISQRNMEFSSPLQVPTSCQISLTNPGHKNLTYRCFISGPDCNDFSCMVPNVETKFRKNANQSHLSGSATIKPTFSSTSNSNDVRVVVPAKQEVQLTIEYRPRFFRPAEAILFAVSERHGPNKGKTVAFTLRGTVSGIGPAPIINVSSPCYEPKEFSVTLVNPYSHGGLFRITTIETKANLFDALCYARDLKATAQTPTQMESDRKEKVVAMSDGVLTDQVTEMNSSETTESPFPGYSQDTTNLQAFFCRDNMINLESAPAAADRFQNVERTPLSLPSDESLQICTPGIANINENGPRQQIRLVYLPLSWGVRNFCLLLSNEEIGEFAVLLHGTAELPKPSPVPEMCAESLAVSGQSHRKTHRLTSAVAAASFGRSGDPSVIYLRVPVGQRISETLYLPLDNESRRKAILMAVRLRLSPAELHRRKMANTLDSADLLELADKLLALPPYPSSGGSKKACLQQRQKRASKRVVYSVESDSTFISVQPTVEVKTDPGDPSAFITSIPISISVDVKKSGLFPARLIVRQPDDVRIYLLECVAVPDSLTISLGFSAPLNQCVTQPVPVPNKTVYDWDLRALITGASAWFSGPTRITAAAGQTTNYPLTFWARRETEVKAKLILSNTTDGTELVYNLKGTGLKPLPLGQIKLSCRVGGCQGRLQSTGQEDSVQQESHVHLHPFTVQVPNPTSKKQIYRLQSDLAEGTVIWAPGFNSNRKHVDVLPGRTEECKLCFRVTKRGHFTGVLAFVADGTQLHTENSDEDQTELSSSEMRKNQKEDGSILLEAQKSNRTDSVYRVWYEIEMNVEAGSPLKQIEVTCSCLSSTTIAVPFKSKDDWFNGRESIDLEVAISGRGLVGPPVHCLSKSQTESVYLLEYWPPMVGNDRGSRTVSISLRYGRKYAPCGGE
ncbi:unnamed protein product [Calicophoron daubneyi]|uniref:Calponin-homology (CH) domain-containing protein n=1 Tax=Calicophoron daubneyi TaxID=300641 RepID=A0AAV2TI70_CALDB